MTTRFSFVECNTHGGPLHGFAVCVHVLEGAPIGRHRQATDYNLGECICAACATKPEADLEDLQLICERCVESGLPARRTVQ